jgi:hypothetical protein
MLNPINNKMPGQKCPKKNRRPRPINQRALWNGLHGRANLGPYRNLSYLRILLSLPVIAFRQGIIRRFNEGVAHSLPAAVGEPQQSRADDDQNAAIDGPLSLTGHETAGQNVDALQEKDDAGKNAQQTDNIQNDLHFGSLF